MSIDGHIKKIEAEIEKEKEINDATLRKNIDYLLEKHLDEYVVVVKGEMFFGPSREEAHEASMKKYKYTDFKQRYVFQITKDAPELKEILSVKKK